MAACVHAGVREVQMPTYCLGEACVGKNKHAHYGKVDSTERTLCGRCAKTHGGVYLGKEMCEDCKDKHASYGEEGGTKQWCGTSAACKGPLIGRLIKSNY